jgi:hypothetical protein
LGAAFTPEVQAAWVAAYTLVAETMIAAAEAAQPQRPDTAGAALAEPALAY